MNNDFCTSFKKHHNIVAWFNKDHTFVYILFPSETIYKVVPDDASIITRTDIKNAFERWHRLFKITEIEIIKDDLTFETYLQLQQEIFERI